VRTLSDCVLQDGGWSRSVTSISQIFKPWSKQVCETLLGKHPVHRMGWTHRQGCYAQFVQNRTHDVFCRTKQHMMGCCHGAEVQCPGLTASITEVTSDVRCAAAQLKLTESAACWLQLALAQCARRSHSAPRLLRRVMTHAPNDGHWHALTWEVHPGDVTGSVCLWEGLSAGLQSQSIGMQASATVCAIGVWLSLLVWAGK
jgi:hypothetical protein